MDSHVEIKSHTSGCLKDELNSRNITGGHLLGRLIVAFERLQQLIQPKTVEYMPLAEENNEIGQDERQVLHSATMRLMRSLFRDDFSSFSLSTKDHEQLLRLIL